MLYHFITLNIILNRVQLEYKRSTKIMAKRRRNGEGSWGKKTIHGDKYFYYRDNNGKYTYGKTEKEVREKLALKTHKELRATPNSKLTLGEYSLAWLKSIKTRIDPNTYDGYEECINSRLIKFKKHYNIADKPMNELTSAMFQKYLDALAEHYAKSTIQKQWTIIKMCIDHAEIKKDIEPLFLTKTCHMPSDEHIAHEPRVINVPTVEECDLIYQECMRTDSKGQRVYKGVADLLILIMETGMRIEEVTALKWENVNFDKCELYVKQVSVTSKKQQRIKNRAKSKAGYRTIPLSNRALETLERLYGKRHNDYVCLTSEGNLYTRSQIEKGLDRIIKNSSCECRKYTPHGLRHGFGSILLSEGADIKAVSVLLGHSKVSFTYDTYIKIFEKDKAKTIDILNQLRNKQKEEDMRNDNDDDEKEESGN